MKEIWTTHPPPHTHTNTHMPNKVCAPTSGPKMNYLRPPQQIRRASSAQKFSTPSPLPPPPSPSPRLVPYWVRSKKWKSDVRSRKLEVIMPVVEKLEVESREVRNSHLSSGSLLFSNFCLHLPLNSTYDSFCSSYFRLLTSYSRLLMPILLLSTSYVWLPFAYLRLPTSYFWFLNS